MNLKNETIFCEILPELCRIYEQKQFADSLNIFMRNLQFGCVGNEREPSCDDVEIEINEIRCKANFENCQAVKQKRMTEYDETMFGVFGEDSSNIKISSVPSEVLDLNARLILPKVSDQYVSEFELRNYEIPLNPFFQEIFSCSSNEIKLCQKIKNEIYLHVDLKKEKQTSRSSLFEAVFLMLEELGMKKEIKEINQLCIPFVHFGKVRISVKLDENMDNVKVKIFNLFGSLFGFMSFLKPESNEEEEEEVFLTEKMLKMKYFSAEFEEDPEDPEENRNSVDKPKSPEVCSSESTTLNQLIYILQNQMNLLKVFRDDIAFTPLPYIGIDSLRLAELEYYVANSPEFKDLNLKAPYLVPYKNLTQVAEFLDIRKKHNLKIEKDVPRESKFQVKTPNTNLITERSKIPPCSETLVSFSKQSKFKIPLSSQQKRILFVREFEKEQIKTDSFTISQFDEPILIQFSEFPNKRVVSTLNNLIMIHSILRTQYLEDYQYLLSGTECFVAIREKEDFQNSSFDSISSFQCFMNSNQRLQIIFNHISIDGRSLLIFYHQFKELLASRNHKIPRIPLQYHDYCRSSSKTAIRTIEYWKQYLNLENVEFERIPSDFSNPSDLLTASYLHKSFPFYLQKKFDTLCHQESLSRFELFLGLLEVSLRRVLGTSGAFSIGFAVDQRTFPFFETIGCFTNVLLYISRKPAKDLMKQFKNCQNTLRESRSHGDISYESIVKMSGTKEDLFQIFVVSDVVEIDSTGDSSEDKTRNKIRVRFEDEEVHVEVVHDPEDIRLEKAIKIAKYPMTWYLRQFGKEEKLHVEVEYGQELFRRETIENILEEIFRIINVFSKPLNSLRKHRSCFDKTMSFNRSDFPSSTVSQMIFSNPSGSTVRYLHKDFKLKPTIVSSYLLKNHIQLYGQLLMEHPIILNIPRGPDLIRAILGAWYAGFYPVPLHKDVKEEQIKKICHGLGIKETIIFKSYDDLKTLNCRVFNRSTLFDFAYVTSTSGSTGIPKLVGTSFEGHSNLARQYTTSFQISSKDTIGQVVDPSFDIFFADIVKTFINGARLLLARDSIATSSELLECTNVYLMPAFLSRLPDMECLRNLETIQYGGEPLAPQVVQEIHRKNEKSRVWQEFGLTEQTVYSARRRIPLNSSTFHTSEEMRIIGKPYDNIRLEIQSFSESTSEKCLRGQLVLSGIGIMRGYFEVTKQVLKEFCTGDEVLKRKNGEIVFIGRKDSQVKIRGHRMDLFEIECVALSSNLIESCTCIAVENQQLALFLKLTSSKNTQNVHNQLKKYLEKELIAYKVPNKLIILHSFPLTRTGKIDKKQLKKMVEGTQEDNEIQETFEKTNTCRKANNLENQLSYSLKYLLQNYSKTTIESMDVDIFSSGIDSIAIMLTIQKLRFEGTDIPVKVFFKLKTIQKIVDWVLTSSREIEDVKVHTETISKVIAKPLEIQDYYINLNHIQQRILFLSRMNSLNSTSSDPFRLKFSINIPLIFRSSNVLCIATNTVIMGNRMLRSKLQRIQGEYNFALLSGTECYRHLSKKEINAKTSNNDLFMTRLWLDKNLDKKRRLCISIHHVICDGRSLQILENQFTNFMKREEVKFQNTFYNSSSPKTEISQQLFTGFSSWKSIYPSFKIGSKSTKIRFRVSVSSKNHQNFNDIPNTVNVAFAYCKAIFHVFQTSTPFPIATTFANRTSENWDTVSMFANTLPLVFEPEQSIGKFSEKFYELNDNSNIPLNDILKSQNGSFGNGNFADFALNFHKKLEEKNDDYEELCQFPMLLTFSETERMVQLEFDETFISRGEGQKLKEEIWKILGSDLQTEKLTTVDFVAIFQKFLNIEISEDSDFFKSGGHSLIAMKMTDYLSDLLEIEIPLKLIFEFRTPKAFEKAMNQLKMGKNSSKETDSLSTEVTIINKKKIANINLNIETGSQDAIVSKSNGNFNNQSRNVNFKFPLSRQQYQMYYLSQLTQNSLEYQLAFIQPFPSIVTPSDIHRSLLMTIQEQVIFRTVFRIDSQNGEPYQEAVSMTESFISCHVETVFNETDLHRRIRELCEEPIDVLSDKSLLKASFISSPGKNVAFLHLHHLISDARSTQLTNSTMKSFFDDLKKNAKRQSFTYMDYCRFEKSEDHVEIYSGNAHSEYFKTLVDGIGSLMFSKVERKIPVKVSLDIPKDFISKKLSHEYHGHTPFSLFLKKISSTLIYYFSNSGPITNFNIAFPILNRNEKTSNICGYFLNNLVINTDHFSTLPSVINTNLPYSDVIREIRRISGKDLPMAEVYINCRYDLEFDESDDEVLLNLVPLKLHFPIEIDVDLLENKTYRITMRSDRLSKEDMLMILENIKKEMRRSEEIQKRRNKKYGNVVYGHLKDTPHSSIPVLYQKLFNSNVTSMFATSKDSHKNFSVSYGQTYRNLLHFSWRLSRDFLSTRASPIRSDDIIAVIGSRSIKTTTKCLSIQFSGASYLPIDEMYPEKRKNEILKDAIFIFKDWKKDEKSYPLPRHHRHFSISTPFCLSYIITTSGTTGNPKSVAIGADSLSNLCLTSTITMRTSNSSRIFQFTNFVFDNSVLEVSMAISSQATLIYGSRSFDPSEFEKLIDNPRISHCLLFPSLVQSFEISKIRRLAYWIVGGERLPQNLLDKALLLGIRVIQNYGPTETTAFAIAKSMKKGDLGYQIGHPSINSKVRISSQNSENSDNDSGELLIAGTGIMRGYLNRETYEYFSKVNGEKWYSSGDICKISNKSQVEFIGRTDSQVKVRGYRVELSEIERIVETHQDITTCKSIFESDSQQIHVFYITKSTKITTENVRKHCERLLEPHKIPSTFNQLEEFPLTENSKIDKVKLLEIVKIPCIATPSEKCSLESELSSIWIELLNCSKPSPSDHFFLIGGHSLLLIRLRHLIQTRLQINPTVPEILENLKFADMLQLLYKKKDLMDEKQGINKKALILFPALYGGCTAYLKMINLLKSLDKTEMNIILLEEETGDTVRDVAVRYKTQIMEKLKNSSFFSFIFIGASSAGTFAFATSQLFHKSDEVTVLLLDSGTFWNLIKKLEYSEHEKEMVENLKIYEVDLSTAHRLARSSWKTLQLLNHYHPEIIHENRRLHVLSVDGTDLGWSKYSKNLKVHKIEGDHYSMLQNSEHVLEIVKIVNEMIYE